MVRNDVPLQLLECIESFKIEVKEKIHGTREHTRAHGEISKRCHEKNREPTHFSNRKAMPLKESCMAWPIIPGRRLLRQAASMPKSAP
jgi:hypothetical protein